MITKIWVKEYENLRERLCRAKVEIEETELEKDKKEGEHKELIAKWAKKKLKLEKYNEQLEYKIYMADKNFSEIERKKFVLKEDLFQEDARLREIKEVKRTEVEQNTNLSPPDKARRLREDLKQAKLDFDDERNYEIEQEKYFQEQLREMKADMNEKLARAREAAESKSMALKEKCSAKETALLVKVEAVDKDLESIDKEIKNQLKELKNLKVKNEMLLRKLHKLSNAKYLTEGISTIKVLDKALNYLEKHPKSIVDDVIFGVLIAKANLKWIISRLKLKKDNKYSWPQDIKKLLEKCNYVINASNNENRSILNKKLWVHEAEDLKAHHLQQSDMFFLPKFDTCQSIDDYIMNGSPDDSDKCIEELFTTNCNVSDYCWFSEFNNKPHSGYKTSHRLIYLQTAKKLHCERKNKKFLLIESGKRKLCQQMVLEASAWYENPYFFLIRDLFMEQIALCGYEGYKEFAPEIWRKEIRRWQSSNGCFGKDMKLDNCSNENSRRVKRTDLTLNKCHTHVTAVATSALAFHLRVILSKLLIL